MTLTACPDFYLSLDDLSGRMFLQDAIIATLCTLSLFLLGKLACRTTWRPARTERGIGRKGQLTNVDKRKLQQNESEQIKTLQHHKGPGQRQDPVGLSPRHNNPCFKHAQTTDQPKLSKTDTERDKHYHTHKKREKRLVYAAAVLVLWMLSPSPKVVNDLSRLLHTAHTQKPYTASTTTYPKVGDAPSYDRTNKTQNDTKFVQSMWCRHTIKTPDCLPDCCCYKLTGASCCSVVLLLADIWQADDTQSQAPWDIASSTSTAEAAVQLKHYLVYQQCTTIIAPQQLAPEAKANLHANRTDAAQPTGASEISDPYWQLVPLFENVTEAKLLETMTCKIHTRDREPATSLSSTWQQKITQPQAPVRTAGSSSSVETNVECKLFPTPHLDDAARGPQQPTLSPQVTTPVKVDMARQSMCDHFKAPAHMRSVEIDLPPNTNVQALLHIAYNEQLLLQQALQHMVPMLNMVLCTLLPILATSAWLFLSIVATAMSIYAETSRTKQSSQFVQHHLPLQAFAILVSVLCMMSTLTMFVLTHLHCMLTLASTYSFLAHPHWVSASLMMIYGPKGMQHFLAGLTQALEHAIQSVVRSPKQPKFAHPTVRNGRYWRRIRNRTRWLHKQIVYKYVKALCWLHQLLQHAKCQHTKHSDTRARNLRADLRSDDEDCIHKQDKAKDQKPKDSNTTQRHKRRNNNDHASKPNHNNRSTAHASKYTNKTKRRKAESWQVAVMMIATGGTQNATNTHFEAQYADASEKNLMQMCKPMQKNTGRILQTDKPKFPRICWGGGIFTRKTGEQRQTEADNETYIPFSTSDEWLSNNHIMHCTLYLLHMHYPTAAHQNMTGVTHSVVPRDELLFKIREASGQVPNTSQSDIAGTLRKTLSKNGPSPAIVVGDDIHWRIILADARSQTVAFIDPFGSGFLQDIVAAIKTFYDNEQPGRWQYKEWTTRLQQRGDTWNCGIWAIWIQEKWMQYWSQNEVTSTFESWFQDNNGTIPAGQDLREHYHAVMQVANRVMQNSRTGFAISRSIAASRWQTNVQSPMVVPGSPDIQATGNRHTQSKTARLHRTSGNSLSSLHTSTKMHGKIHKKPKSTRTAAQEDCCHGCKGTATAKTQARCIMIETRLACSTTQLVVQQAASCPPLITADTAISQVAYKHTLLI